MENWKEIPGMNGVYLISNLGRIKSVSRMINSSHMAMRRIGERIIMPRLDSRGRYKIVTLGKKTFLLHRLLAGAFIGNIIGLEVNHIDGDPSNNSINNLELVTRSENEKHKYRVLKRMHPFTGKRGDRHSRSKKIARISPLTNEVVQVYESARIAESDGYISSSISLCCNSKQKTHKGFIWSFID